MKLNPSKFEYADLDAVPTMPYAFMTLIGYYKSKNKILRIQPPIWTPSCKKLKKHILSYYYS